ncbi:Translational (tr)-type GTP-binding domain [Dillenia turbinata]|uniref:Translational (Tr)-type GTP-binding domain n=1 Tax=Dillenia turbinata TaxID=194707 RepID=A0AAN8YV38_9MAGN
MFELTCCVIIFVYLTCWCCFRKPHVNVGTIGHVDHGKTTLTAAITKVKSLQKKAKQKLLPSMKLTRLLKRGSEESLLLQFAHVEFETGKRQYTHVDCPGHADYVKGILCIEDSPLYFFESYCPKGLLGIIALPPEHDHWSCPDGWRILVVSALDRPMPQIKQHILLAHQVGVPSLVCFLNKVDDVDDPELFELVEMELQELLNFYNFPGDEIPIIGGSALSALQGTSEDIGKNAILKLMEAVDQYIPDPVCQLDKPFLMPIEDVFSIQVFRSQMAISVADIAPQLKDFLFYCTVVRGRVEQGTIKVGDDVEVLGLMQNVFFFTVVVFVYVGGPLETTVMGVEMFKKILDHGQAGDNVGLLLRGLKRDDVQRGQVSEPH